MKKATLFLLYLVIGTMTIASAGNHPYLAHYRIADGITSRFINCISQDESGFIWIGSETGLDRFDGFHFKHYDIADGRTVFSIYAGKRGKARNSRQKQSGAYPYAPRPLSSTTFAIKCSSGRADRAFFCMTPKLKLSNNSADMHQ